jgi:hypothetical protein
MKKGDLKKSYKLKIDYIINKILVIEKKDHLKKIYYY